MSKTIAIQAYSYAELSDKAKDKVKEWLNRDMQLFDKYEREAYEEELGKLGYSDIDIQYSGFYSQGDGALIACTVDVAQFIARNKLGNKYRKILNVIKKYGVDQRIKIYRERWGHYVHDNLLRYDIGDFVDDMNVFVNVDDSLFSDVENLAQSVLEEVKEKSRELYSYLETDYEWHYEDEYMIDCCEANEYFFDEYGDPVHHLELEKAES